jgi:hypothetical protein
VRVEGRGRRSTLGGTNIAITLFTPSELLNQYTVQTREIPNRECLRFTNGNRVIIYRSTADAFTFDAVSKSLTNAEKE